MGQGASVMFKLNLTIWMMAAILVMQLAVLWKVW
jgi:hypothetical protein